MDDATRRERARDYYRRNADRIKAQQQQYRKANPRRRRKYQRAAPGDVNLLKRTREYRSADPDISREWMHGREIHGVFPALWHAQQGLCYLCGDPLDIKRAVIEHDHTCCPAGRSCPYCRRGLACNRCNLMIGHVRDDPDLLRTIADNLEPVLKATRERIAGKPRQGELL